jgi:hypothetical protein
MATQNISPFTADSGATRQSVLREAVRLTAIAAAVLLLTVLTISRSEAAFSAQTSNSGNGFSTGTVLLTDDDNSASLFTASGLSPLNPVVKCIEITYGGDLLDADVKMYGSASGPLADHLNVTVDVGTGGTFADCSGFAPTSSIWTGSLSSFGTTHTDWSNGLDVFTATTNPDSRTLRFSVSVSDNNAAQNLSASATFVWESQEV